MTTNDCHAEFVVLDDLQLVRVNVRGDLNYKDLAEIVETERSLTEAKSYTRLYDFRSCDFFVSIQDLYAFPRPELSMQSTRREMVRVALLVPEHKDLEHYSFSETAVQNGGLNIRVFTCEEFALGWVV